MKQTIKEHRKTISNLEMWLRVDKQYYEERIARQEADLLQYKTELERALRKGLKVFERGKI